MFHVADGDQISMIPLLVGSATEIKDTKHIEVTASI